MIIAIVPAPGHEALVAEGPAVDGCVPERPMTIDVRRPASEHPCVAGCLMNLFRRPPLDLSSLKPGDECPACYDKGLVSVPALVLYAPGDPKLGMLRAMEAAGMCVDVAAGVAYPDTLDGITAGGSGWWASYSNERGGHVRWDVPEPPANLGLATDAWSLARLLVQRGIAVEVLVLPADKAKE